MIICGIDEAGRGPCIGPLVIAGVCIEEGKDGITKLGVKDSKQLTPRIRFNLFDKIIKSAYSYKIIEVEAQEIDSRCAVGTNLNEVEAIKAAAIIKELEPDKVYVDSPHPIAKKFEHVIRKHLPDDIKVEIICEHQADVTYPVASAASILAKVTRDRAIEAIEIAAGEKIGSGYSSDPITKAFLKKHGHDSLGKHIRKCWQTIRNLKAEKEQSKLGEF